MPQAEGTAPDRRLDVGLAWLVRLRWGAAAGQLATVAVAQAAMGIRLPLLRLLVPIAITVLTNVALAVALRRRVPLTRPRCGAVLVLDTLLLSALLHATGGAANPFSILYLVQITVAAVVLGPRWTWSLAVLSVGCYGLLFFTHLPLGHPAAGHDETGFSVHLQGMWVAFAVAAALTAYFVVKLATAIERQEAELAAVKDAAARNERLASLTTLAAGAAHELGTPLATIAVAARELERGIRDLPRPAADALAEDARLIRAELERCRAILNRLAADTGQAPGEAPVPVALRDILTEIVDGLPVPLQSRLSVTPAPADRPACVPRGALVQVARSLLSNAFEAGEGPVRLSVESEGARVRLRVQDEGPGMPPEVLARAGEPFFTTKPAGRGLGLGLFLARTLSEQMGGRLTLQSWPGRGTTATVEILEAPGGTAHAR